MTVDSQSRFTVNPSVSEESPVRRNLRHQAVFYYSFSSVDHISWDFFVPEDAIV